MKNIIKFILFIIYTISIFLIEDLRIIGCMFLINFILALICKTNLKSMFYNFKLLLPFIIFTMIINIFWDSLYAGILMGIRLFVCYNITYIFSKTMTVLELSSTIQNLLFPLKIFKIDTKNIGIIISISICMIPVLNNEIHTLVKAMKSKGKKIKVSNILIVMKPILISILRKTNEMEKSLIVKGYISE